MTDSGIKGGQGTRMGHDTKRGITCERVALWSGAALVGMLAGLLVLAAVSATIELWGG